MAEHCKKHTKLRALLEECTSLNPTHKTYFPLKCTFEKEISYDTQPKHRSSKTERHVFTRIAQKFYIQKNRTVISKKRKSNLLGLNLETAPPGVDSVEMDLEVPKEIKIHELVKQPSQKLIIYFQSLNQRI